MRMQRALSLMLLGLVTATAAHADTPKDGAKKAVERSAFLDFAENRMGQYYCERDGTYMRCLGVDIRSNNSRCVELVRQGARDCRQRMLPNLPASISQGPEFNRYAGEFSRCLGLTVITASGKPFDEVDKCLAQGSAEPKARK